MSLSIGRNILCGLFWRSNKKGRIPWPSLGKQAVFQHVFFSVLYSGWSYLLCDIPSLHHHPERLVLMLQHATSPSGPAGWRRRNWSTFSQSQMQKHENYFFPEQWGNTPLSERFQHSYGPFVHRLIGNLLVVMQNVHLLSYSVLSQLWRQLEWGFFRSIRKLEEKRLNFLDV